MGFQFSKLGKKYLETDLTLLLVGIAVPLHSAMVEKFPLNSGQSGLCIHCLFGIVCYRDHPYITSAHSLTIVDPLTQKRSVDLEI